MTVERMDHVGIVVDDLPAAIAFFVALGLEHRGGGVVQGRPVDRIVGLEDVRSEFAFVQTPDGHGRLELIKFHSPAGSGGDPGAPANTPGIRHVTFAVDDIDAAVAGLRAHGAELVGEVVPYGGSYRLCYVRGPEGIIVEARREDRLTGGSPTPPAEPLRAPPTRLDVGEQLVDVVAPVSPRMLWSRAISDGHSARQERQK